MTKVTINGNTFITSGRGNISIAGNRVIIDGKVVELAAQGVVEVKVEGDLIALESDASVTVSESVNGNVSAGGSVRAGNVSGSVNAGGSAHCGTVSGHVNAGGSVHHG